MQGGVSLFPVGTFFMHFCECLDFGQTEASNPRWKCHYAFSKCGEFHCHPKPPFFFAAMLLFDSLTGCDKRSGTRHVVVSHYSSSSVSRSQQQSVSHSAGGGGVCGSREDEKKKERKKKRATERRIFTTQTVARVSCIPMSVPLLPGSITLRRVGICLRGDLQVLQVSRSPGVCVSALKSVRSDLIKSLHWQRSQSFQVPFSLQCPFSSDITSLSQLLPWGSVTCLTLCTKPDLRCVLHCVPEYVRRV